MLKLLLTVVTVLGFTGSLFAQTPNPAPAQPAGDTSMAAPAATPDKPAKKEKKGKKEAKASKKGSKKGSKKAPKTDEPKPTEPAPAPATK